VAGETGRGKHGSGGAAFLSRGFIGSGCLCGSGPMDTLSFLSRRLWPIQCRGFPLCRAASRDSAFACCASFSHHSRALGSALWPGRIAAQPRAENSFCSDSSWARRLFQSTSERPGWRLVRPDLAIGISLRVRDHLRERKSSQTGRRRCCRIEQHHGYLQRCRCPGFLPASFFR
jgi:hypothetical protein